MSKTPELALFGGAPIRKAPFVPQNNIGPEERQAVAEVLDSGVFSGFLGTWSPQFYGGSRVQKLEREWEAYFGVKHAVSVNSATSGLIAAVGAAGIGPGDEVIVTPYSMSASAACVLVYNAIPVFADIDPETFCITAETIRERITSYTKAIVVVDLFGRPAEMREIMLLAEERGLTVIEDAAQAPGARYHGRYAGTLGHIGVFSLNYHKHIHTGEGGLLVTDHPEFAERAQLIRNHGEVVAKDKGVKDFVNLLGFNFRMTEIEAAIASEQLKKLASLVERRQQNCEYLINRLRRIDALTLPAQAPHIEHSYYMLPIRYDAERMGVPRAVFAAALKAEGIPVGEGYVEPIYLEPMYQQRVVFGNNGCPFTCGHYTGEVNYAKGRCPVVERMYERELLVLYLVHASTTRQELDDVAVAFEKVAHHADELRAAAAISAHG